MAEGLRVVAPGVASTLQDAGRQGYLRYGISGSGAMDPDLLALANALVGNPLDTAVIEMAMVGPTLVCEVESCRIALAGAPFAMSLNGRTLDPFTAHDLRRGDRLILGAPPQGLRACLAVAGGFAVAPMLASVSTHTCTCLGGLDGNPLAAGELLPLGAPKSSDRPLTLPPHHRPRFGGPIRVVLGPQADSFTEEGLQTFLSAPYTLTARADRMGCHLDGPPIAHANGFNIVSDGIVNGSIQVPGHGRPLILLADRHTTGGYPKIATVISSDLGRLAQVRPGETIVFEAVTVEEAQSLARGARRTLAARRAALVPAGGAELDSAFLLSCNLIGGVISANALEPAARGRDGSVQTQRKGLSMLTPFHLAYHVTDLDAARRFYGGVLGCREGRSTETWVDFEFFGHQISLHLGEPFATTRTGKVGTHMVMMPHLDVVLPLDTWETLAARIEAEGVAFDIPPVIRFAGEPGEQRTMFFFDPSGNPIEIKGFRDLKSVFEH